MTLQTKYWRDPFAMFRADAAGTRTSASTSNAPITLRLTTIESVRRIAKKYSRNADSAPATEASGRIHTSAATVAVLPEAEEVDISIDPKDLRIDTFCSSGPGGQSVNTTYSAIRITHIPTGLVVSQQDKKSQVKNRQKAMKVLRSRLYEMEMRKQQEAIAKERRGQVGTGERSEKIRTYNFPQDRVTDHRAGETVHGIVRLMDGELDPLVDRLIAWDREIRLREMGAPGIVGLPAGVRPGADSESPSRRPGGTGS